MGAIHVCCGAQYLRQWCSSQGGWKKKGTLDRANKWHHCTTHQITEEPHKDTHTHTHTLASSPHAHFSSYSYSRPKGKEHTHTCQKDVQLINTLLPLTPDTSSKTAGLYASAGNQPHSLIDEWQLLPMGLAMETVWIQENPCKQQTGPPQSQAPLTLHANKTLKTPEGDNGLAMD